MTASPAIQYSHTLDGIRIAYYVMGTGSPVMVLQANPSSHLTLEWDVPALRSFYERLAQHAMLIRLDYRGSGLSERRIDHLTEDDIVADVNAVVGQLGLDRWAFYGWGFGGTNALAYAARYPGRVSRIVLAEANASEGGLSLNRRLAGLREVNTDVQIRTRANLMAGWADPVNAEGMVALISGAIETGTIPVMWRQLIGDSDIFKLAAEVAVPVLLIHAKDDPLFSLAGAQKLAASLRKSRLKIVSSSASLAPFTNSDAVSDAIEFLLPSGESPPGDASAPPGLKVDVPLSGREIEVLKLIAAGKTNQEIARDLFISVSTVSHHVSNILAKTGAVNRTEAAAFAHRLRLL